jgi:hypothetical protein
MIVSKVSTMTFQTVSKSICGVSLTEQSARALSLRIDAMIMINGSNRDDARLGVGALAWSVSNRAESQELAAPGRAERRTEAFIGGLPGGSYALKALNQLDLIINPRDQEHDKHIRTIIVGYDDDLNRDLSGRTAIWHYALETIQLRPWLGYGYGFWVTASTPKLNMWMAKGWPMPHAHEEYLDITLQTGIIGLCLEVFCLALALMRAARFSFVLEDGKGLLCGLMIGALCVRGVTETVAGYSLPDAGAHGEGTGAFARR